MRVRTRGCVFVSQGDVGSASRPSHDDTMGLSLESMSPPDIGTFLPDNHPHDSVPSHPNHESSGDMSGRASGWTESGATDPRKGGGVSDWGGLQVSSVFDKAARIIQLSNVNDQGEGWHGV